MTNNQAIPLVKSGAYLLVFEIAFVALATGLIALVPPPIVGGLNAIPSWGKYVVAVIAFVTAAWQIVGLAAVMGELSFVYNIYSALNMLATIVLFIFTVAFAATAAGKHDNAIDGCLDRFEQPILQDGLGIDQVEDKLNTGRRDVCNVLGWVDVGLMFGLIALLTVTQLYMCYMQRQYGLRQRMAIRDTKANPDSIPLDHRESSFWERRRPEYEPVTTNTMAPHNEETFYDTYTR
mgnify:FL=1